MFSGIVSGVGVVCGAEVSSPDLKLLVDTGDTCRGEVTIGDSIAVDGVCLTVTVIEGDQLGFDVSQETLARTLLSSRAPGDKVNIELALRPTTRLGGHIVTGHVDGIGCLEHMERVGASTRFRFAAPAELAPFIAEKGSICVDGISLTVNAVDGNVFEVNIVPHTAQVTTASEYQPGRYVHLEVDIIARYLARLMATRWAAPRSEAMDRAREPDTSPGKIMQEYLSTSGFAAPRTDE